MSAAHRRGTPRRPDFTEEVNREVLVAELRWLLALDDDGVIVFLNRATTAEVPALALLLADPTTR